MAQDWFNALFGPYFERQGKIAQESSAFADAGAKSFREQGNPLGLGQMALGAAGWLGSPIGALVPHGIEQNSVVPEALKPAVKGALDFTDYFMPGPNEFIAPAQSIIIPAMFANSKQLKNLPDYQMALDEAYSKVNNQQQLNRATQDIWQEYGWDRPVVDTAPRTEIPIRDTEIVKDALMRARPGKTTTDYLANIWKAPQVYKQVPQLANVPVNIKWGDYDSGRFVGGTLQGYYGANAGPRSLKGINITAPINATDNDLIGTFAHEGTHAVDFLAKLLDPQVENWNNAGDSALIRKALAEYPDYDPYKFYLRLGSETNARNAEQRYNAGQMLTGRTGDLARRFPEFYHPKVTDSNLAYLAPSLSNPVPVEEQIPGYWLDDALAALTNRQKATIKRPLPGDVSFK